MQNDNMWRHFAYYVKSVLPLAYIGPFKKYARKLVLTSYFPSYKSKIT
jgi:hypothetical protein